jgi:ATP/maltotriose-dependent transcriptional regulator MalT
MLFLLQHHRIEMLFYRARIALALAGRGDTNALRRAEQDARRLDREGAPWARAVAKLVAGTCAQVGGRDAEAASALESAEMQLSACNMTLFAAAAQYRRGRLVGGTAGQALVDHALAAMQEQQVVNPQRLARVLAPGP